MDGKCDQFRGAVVATRLAYGRLSRLITLHASGGPV